MICIKCGVPRAHRSHRAGLADNWNRLFRRVPYRCKACKARFYAYRSGEKSDSMRSGEERRIMSLRRKIRWKKTKKELAVYAVAGLIMAFVVYIALQQRMG